MWKCSLSLPFLISLALVAAVAVGACSDTPVQNQNAEGAQEPAPISSVVRNEVDILWVIDDSTAMRPFQVLLSQDFPTLTAALSDPSVYIDFNMAVVAVNPEEFSFRDRPDPTEFERRNDLGHCHGVVGPVLSASDYRDHETGAVDLKRLHDDFVCISAVGEHATSATEMGLETMRRALEAADGENARFLRDSSHLVVIFLTEEDDCSHSVSMADNPPRSQRCYLASEYSRLTSVDEYEEFLLSLRGADLDDPESVRSARANISVLGLIGPPMVEGAFSPTLIEHSYENVASTCSGNYPRLAKPAQSCDSAEDCFSGLSPAPFICLDGECGRQVVAVSSYRYWDLMRRFVPSYDPFDAHGGIVPPSGTAFWEDDAIRFAPPADERPWQAICEDSYAAALDTLAERITGAFDINCIPSPPQSCEQDRDCSRGSSCILDQPEYGGCPARGLCEDFAIHIEFFRDGEVRDAAGAVTAAEYCQLRAEAQDGGVDVHRTGGYVPPEGAEFWVDYAARCPHDIGFAFTAGNQPDNDDRFRLRYPISRSDDF